MFFVHNVFLPKVILHGVFLGRMKCLIKHADNGHCKKIFLLCSLNCDVLTITGGIPWIHEEQIVSRLPEQEELSTAKAFRHVGSHYPKLYGSCRGKHRSWHIDPLPTHPSVQSAVVIDILYSENISTSDLQTPRLWCVSELVMYVL